MNDRRDIWTFGTTLAAQAVVGSINLSVATWQLARDLRTLVGSLVRITAPGGPVDRLAELADEIRPLAISESLNRLRGLGDSLERLSRLGDSLEQLSRLSDSLEQLSRLGDYLEQLSRVGETLPALTERAAALPEMVQLTRDMEGRVRQIAGRLDTLSPDIGALAGTIGDLQQSVRVLGGAIGPLQGTAERVGRLVERFPKTRRPAVDPGVSE